MLVFFEQVLLHSGGRISTIFAAIMKKIIVVLLCVMCTIPLSAQMAVEAELAVAYPLYFNKEEIGLNSDGFHTGFRFGAYDFDDDWPFIWGVRYTFLSNKDSALIDVSDQNYQHMDLSGTARVRFNSIVPHLGLRWETVGGPLWSASIMVGMGIAWGKAEYDLPGYDSTTMSYFNPPWNRTGKFNEERKLVSVRPCMNLAANLYYEMRYFYLFACADIHYSLGEFPSSPLALSAGILIPIDGKE